MVAAQNVVVDECGFESWRELGRGAEVIDAPADISLAGAVLVAPPCVAPTSRFEVAEGVYKASCQCEVKGLALLKRESSVLRVVLRSRQIDLAVCHIHISTEDDGLDFFECCKVVDECWRPLPRAVVKSSQFTLGIGCVNIHQEKISYVGADHAPLLVMFLAADAIYNRLRLFARENRCAGIAGFDGRIPVNLIPVERPGHLFLSGFDLLQADHIRLLGLEIIYEPLAEY